MIQRWRRAGERAEEEQIRVLRVGSEYLATSASRPFGYYRLTQTASGWRCECPANHMFGMPCKHLWALAELLDLDLLSEVGAPGEQPAAQSSAA
jgi:hypothetical protein